MTNWNPAATTRPLCIPEAIARMEGWNVSPPARCRRNLNPGNIEYGSFAQGHHGVMEQGEHPRFAAFPDVETGFGALVALLQTPRYKGRSLQNAINNWAPPSENNTNEYLTMVCQWTKLNTESIIDEYLYPPETPNELPAQTS